MIKIINNLIKKVLTAEIIYYILFGMLTTLVGFIIYTICLNKGYGIVVSNTISTFIAIAFAYITNKVWVFKSLHFNIKIMVKEFLRFLSSRFITYIIDTILLVALVSILLWNPILSKGFTSLVVVLLNYIASKKIVFKK